MTASNFRPQELREPRHNNLLPVPQLANKPVSHSGESDVDNSMGQDSAFRPVIVESQLGSSFLSRGSNRFNKITDELPRIDFASSQVK